MLRQAMQQMLAEEAAAQEAKATKIEDPVPTGLKNTVAAPCCKTPSRVRPDFQGTILAP